MFVKCKVKTVLAVPVEFLLNRETIVTMEKIVGENRLNFHIVNGSYDFLFDSEEIKNEVYEAFVELLATGESVISDNISLLTL